MLYVNRRSLGVFAGIAVGMTVGLMSAQAHAAPISYQGTLEDNQAPAEGMYDMVFTLADSSFLGLALQIITIDDVEVSDGLFEVELNFDDEFFDGSDRWIAVRVEGTSLSPRQEIKYTPYAIRATSSQQANLALDLRVPWVVIDDMDIVDATSSRGIPIRGYMSNSSLSNPGVIGETESRASGAAGVLGRANSRSDASPAVGVLGVSESTGFQGAGVQGIHNGNGVGVVGQNNGLGNGVIGLSVSGTGVFGSAPNGDGIVGSSISGFGVSANSSTQSGIRSTTNTGDAAVEGSHSSGGTSFLGATDEFGLEAFNIGTPGEGTAIEGVGGRVGVRGVARPDGFGSDLTRIGVDGFAGGFNTGANMTYGVRGFAQNPANGGGRTAYGVYGGAQVGSTASTAYGVFGEIVGPVGGVRFAGFFQGDVHVAGTLSKSSGTFKIDHPMDPENKYLSHSFVESPEMLNVYSGVVTLDDSGRGIVELPHYFDSLNSDYRYQLTAIGAAMPSLHVAELIEGNSFVVGGGASGKQVSWEVTGVRIDASATYRPIVVEQDKAEQHRGLYLDPEAHGFGIERAIHSSERTDQPEN
ncbi:MAG: hypothetical protein AB8C13_07335 [Phycisphaerales bacterium]